MLSVGNDGVLQAMLRALLVLPDAGHRPPHYGCGVQLSALLVRCHQGRCDAGAAFACAWPTTATSPASPELHRCRASA